jgi:fatty-acid desaturase
MPLLLIILLTRTFQIFGLLSLLWLLVYSFNYGWLWFLISFVYYKVVIGMLANQIAQHRYISHNSFKTGPMRHKFLSWISILTGISPVIYAGIHRHHHVHSDTENDPHSPNVSFYHSAFGWFNGWSNYINGSVKVKYPFDIIRDPTHWFVHRYGHLFLILLISITFLLSWKFTIFVILAGLGWNFIHMGVIRSALVHTKLPGSYKNFDITDNSWNNQYIQFFDIGEGLHNNHHKFPNKYNQATTNKEFDPVGWLVEKYFVVKMPHI